MKILKGDHVIATDKYCRDYPSRFTKGRVYFVQDVMVGSDLDNLICIDDDSTDHDTIITNKWMATGFILKLTRATLIKILKVT